MENFENKNLNNKPNIKKLNLRDYDKEPIIIQNKLSYMNFLIIIFCLLLFAFFIIIFDIEFGFGNYSAQGTFAGLAYAIKEFFTRKENNIKFTNSTVQYMINGKIEAEIKLTEISKVAQTCSNSYKNEQKLPISNEFIIASVVIIGIFIFIFRGFSFFAIAILTPVISYFLARFSVHIWQNGKISDYQIFDGIVIFSSNNLNKINFLPNLLERQDIGQYFLDLKQINIEKTKKRFSIF